jgi:histidine triad (HIT) family protein
VPCKGEGGVIGNTAKAMLLASQLITKAIKQLFQPDGITICQNGGKFNDLTHVHVHVVPRYEHTPFSLFYGEEPLENEKEKQRLHYTSQRLREFNTTIEKKE